MVEQPFSAVAILGLGVMGGSLARALSALEPKPDVTGWSPVERERAAALEAAVVSAASDDWRDAVADADLVVLAAPLRASCELVADVVEAMPDESTLSDVASLKVPVSRAVAAAGAEDRWVGSHPMAGSEESGFAASRADLYAGATVWLVSHPAAAERVPGVSALWRALGAGPEPISSEAHDRLMALASHLPQLASNALAEVLAAGRVSPDSLGPGGSDMTRLAASSPVLWRDILEHASPELVSGLRALAANASRVADRLERSDLAGIEQLMNATSAWSRSE